MRDLKADLEYCKKAHFDGKWLHTPMDFIDKAYKGWPHAIERAIKAEELARELVTTLEGAVFWLNVAGYSVEDCLFMASKAKEVLGDE